MTKAGFARTLVSLFLIALAFLIPMQFMEEEVTALGLISVVIGISAGMLGGFSLAFRIIDWLSNIGLWPKLVNFITWLFGEDS